MGWEVVIPEATENLITNPSIESATTGYSAAAGATLARVATDRAAGVACLSVTPTSSTTDGVYYAMTLATTTTYAFSASVKGVDGIPYKIVIYDQTAGSPLGTTTFTGDGTWKRYSVTATTGANTSIRLYVQKNTHVSTGAFYVDAMQLEQKAYATTYCDGDQPGCAWSAGAHTSSSTRSAQSAEGGRVRDLSTDYGFDVRSSVGVGMPPVDLIESQPAQSDGADHQRAIARARSFQLIGMITGDDRSDYHSERLALINALNPHRLATDQPVRLRYYNGNNRVEIGCRYEGGLEKIAQENPAVEAIGLRFRAQEDPLFVKAAGSGGGQQGAINDGLVPSSVQVSISDADYIAQRSAAGAWSALGTGMNTFVNALAVGPDGRLYAGGSFTTAGGTSANYIAVWDGSSWSALGSGMNGTVFALAFGPDGTLYAGGNFTTAGGGSANRVAAWDGSSWSALGTGLNNQVLAVAVGPNGNVYVGGAFDTAGGGSADLVAVWNGSSWSAIGSGVGSGGPTEAVYALAVGPDGTLYAGGSFPTAGGSAANRVAAWDGSAWSALGDGSPAAVRALVIGPDGRLYAGGEDFSDGGVVGNYIIAWNGSTWTRLGGQFTDSGGAGDGTQALAFDNDGLLWAGGIFDDVGGLTLPSGLARWNGSSWAQADITLPGTATILGIVVAPDGTLTIGYNTSGTATAAIVTGLGGETVATNDGSARAYPVFTVTGPGRLYSLVNYTTEQAIYFDMLLVDGETVTLDLRPGAKTFDSSFRGNVIDKILPGSDVESFVLAPGDNNISIYVDDNSAEAALTWNERHWSFDGVAA